MQVTVLDCSYTPLKGARHQNQSQLELGPEGIQENRRWALVDPTRRTVLRSVAYPQFMRISAKLSSRQGSNWLSLHIPNQGSYTLPPLTKGNRENYKFWGTNKQLALYNCPVNKALSNYLGSTVQLAYAPQQNLIYSGALSLIGSASLADICAQAQAQGQPKIDAARLRCNLIIKTSTPYIEESWQGQSLTLQAGPGTPAQLQGLKLLIEQGIGRCCLIDANPTTGQRDASLLKLLTNYRPRNQRGEPLAGVYARPLLQEPAPGRILDEAH